MNAGFLESSGRSSHISSINKPWSGRKNQTFAK